MSRSNDTGPGVTDALRRAVEIAQGYGHEYVTLEHLLASLIEESDIRECLTKHGVEADDLGSVLEQFFGGCFIPLVEDGLPSPTESFNEVVMRAVGSAMFSIRAKAQPIDLLLHLLQYPAQDSHAVSVLLRRGMSALMVKRWIAQAEGTPPAALPGSEGGDWSKEFDTPAEAAEFLSQFCANLNALGKRGGIDPLIGRETEVARLIEIAARRTKNNAILVGEPGVGKTAIAEGLAVRIAAGEVPEVLADSTVWSLDVGALVAGTRYRGEFEERTKLLLKALAMQDSPILFIDEIHMVMGTGSHSQGSMDMANMLKPVLAKGAIRCIGSTTLEEYRKHFEKDRALLRRFKRLDVTEPSQETAKLILRGLQSAYEGFHGVSYTEAALDAAVDLTVRHISGAHLPDKAIDVLDAAGAVQRVALPEVRKSVVDVMEIEAEVAKVARIPPQTVAEDEGVKLARLEDDLREVVYGQDSAITNLAAAVMVSRAGLREANKPTGVFLLTGPTGVGKTEIAKQLARTLGVELVRFDMSEYQERHSVARLIGAPPGYVGFDSGGAGSGLLISALDSHPRCVLLLDEIEKAHPDIYNILLQVMDDGRLTNTSGKTADFRNAMILMTSNAGAGDTAPTTKTVIAGFGRSPANSQLSNDAHDAAVKRVFSPEFRNRLDAVVRFAAITQETMLRVVDKFVSQLAGMAAERGVTLDLDTQARAWLAEKGYDKEMGARPLARVIHREIKEPLARLMITGPLRTPGIARVRLVDDKLTVVAA